MISCFTSGSVNSSIFTSTGIELPNSICRVSKLPGSSTASCACWDGDVVGVAIARLPKIPLPAARLRKEKLLDFFCERNCQLRAPPRRRASCRQSRSGSSAAPGLHGEDHARSNAPRRGLPATLTHALYPSMATWPPRKSGAALVPPARDPACPLRARDRTTARMREGRTVQVTFPVPSLSNPTGEMGPPQIVSTKRWLDCFRGVKIEKREKDLHRISQLR